MKRRIIIQQHPGIGAALVEGGSFFFTSGFDGNRDPALGEILPDLAGRAEPQCENSYGKLLDVLREVNLGPEAIVRLDHLTSSQDWLPQRSAIRARIFGRPANLASTGVATRMTGINMLTTSAIATSAPQRKQVLVGGPETHGVSSIASAVRAGPFLFLSGIRGVIERRTGKRIAEETAQSFPAQVKVCYEGLVDILAQCGATPDHLLRLDCYVRDINRANEAIAVRRDVLGDVACAATTVGLPLGARGEVEISGIALVPEQGTKIVHRGTTPDVLSVSAGGWVLVSECLGNVPDDLPGKTDEQIRRVLDKLDESLALAGSTLDDVLRLDIYLRDIYRAARLEELLRKHFRDELPAILLAGADPRNGSEVALNAIATRG
jgi:enamine deaminase RidA (YjgF/YER057c/UK114 family)